MEGRVEGEVVEERGVCARRGETWPADSEDDGDDVQVDNEGVPSQPRPHRLQWALSQTTLPGPGGVGRAER